VIIEGCPSYELHVIFCLNFFWQGWFHVQENYLILLVNGVDSDIICELFIRYSAVVVYYRIDGSAVRCTLLGILGFKKHVIHEGNVV
jgi:hypothetical protein